MDLRLPLARSFLLQGERSPHLRALVFLILVLFALVLLALVLLTHILTAFDCQVSGHGGTAESLTAYFNSMMSKVKHPRLNPDGLFTRQFPYQFVAAYRRKTFTPMSTPPSLRTTRGATLSGSWPSGVAPPPSRASLRPKTPSAPSIWASVPFGSLITADGS